MAQFGNFLAGAYQPNFYRPTFEDMPALAQSPMPETIPTTPLPGQPALGATPPINPMGNPAQAPALAPQAGALTQPIQQEPQGNWLDSLLGIGKAVLPFAAAAFGGVPLAVAGALGAGQAASAYQQQKRDRLAMQDPYRADMKIGERLIRPTGTGEYADVTPALPQGAASAGKPIGAPRKMANGQLGQTMQLPDGSLTVVPLGEFYQPPTITTAEGVPIRVNPDGTAEPVIGGTVEEALEARARRELEQKGALREQASEIELSEEQRDERKRLQAEVDQLQGLLTDFKGGKYQTGPIAGRLPNVRQSAQELESQINQLTLDAISSATFGSLSEGERAFLSRRLISDEFTEEANIANLERRLEILNKLLSRQPQNGAPAAPPGFVIEE
jgi:hypothetical protein